MGDNSKDNEMTDTARLEWVRAESSSIFAMRDEKLQATGFAALHEEIGWGPVRPTPGEAIDAAALEVMRSRAQAKKREKTATP